MRHSLLLLLPLITLWWDCITAFLQPHKIVYSWNANPNFQKVDLRSSSKSQRWRFQSNDNNNEDPGDAEHDSFKMDEFLDKPFFDPEAYDSDDTSLLGKFANLVKNDYPLAETLFVGTLFVVLLIITQELLRLQLYGDDYVPFVRSSGSSSKLF